MNLAYKKINSSNVSKYIANKSFTVDPSIETEGITIYIGENSPINKKNYFDVNNDNRTSNDEYRRLVFNNIRHLFYKSYDNADQLFQSSSRYNNSEESTYYSGSYNTTLRRLGQVTGSSFAGITGLYDVAGTLYDDTQLYDYNPFTIGAGDLMTVVSLDTQLYGSKLTPKEILIEIKEYLIDDVPTDLYIRDDGEGNLFDFSTEAAYQDFLDNGTVPENYIGNILYSLGLIIIVDQDYICIFGAPPTAVNNYYTYLNTQQPESFDVTQNDFNDCGGIAYDSIALVAIEGEDFPDAFIDSDYAIRITQNQKAFIPGVYKIGYTIDNNKGLTSNVGILTVTIYAEPLTITNLNAVVSCDETSDTQYSFNIEGGVPVYAWSLDGINYKPTEGFYNIGVNSSSFFPNDQGTIYVKDYLDNVTSATFRTRYLEPDYTVVLSESSACNPNNGSILLESNEDFVYNISGSSMELESNVEYPLSAGDYELLIKVGDQCVYPREITLEQGEGISIDTYIENNVCYSGSEGYISIQNITGGTAPYTTKLTYPDNRTSTQKINKFLPTGTYLIEVTDDRNCTFSTNVDVTSPDELIVSSSVSYTNPCYPTVNLSSTGGNGGNTYYITTGYNTYITTNSSLDLIYESLDTFNMSIYVIDSEGCASKTIIQKVEGREYIYSGSYCEQT